MSKKNILIVGLFLTALANSSFALRRDVAVTIDDLPFVGDSKNFHLNMIIEAFKANDTPATGFVIAKEVTPQNLPMLRKFREAGLSLGNHTLSHNNLNRMDALGYIQDIDAADKILSPLMSEPKYFRYPYLVIGSGEKKNKIQQYLSSKNYHIAPISIDSKDFIFNQLLLSVPEAERRHFLTVLKPCYLDFIWQQTLKAEEHNRYAHTPNQAQILLIHANLLNAYVLPDIINLYKQNGFNFVSLNDALNEPTEAAPLAPKPTDTAANDKFLAWD